MANAKLHIICGNCGCNNDFKLIIEREGDDITDEVTEYEDSARLICRNCSTLHDIKDNAVELEAERTVHED